MTFANVHFSSLFTPWTYYPHQLIPLVTPALKAASSPNEFVSIDHDLLRKRTQAVALSTLALLGASIIFPASIGIIPGMFLAGIRYLISYFEFDLKHSETCRIKKIFQECNSIDTFSDQQALTILESEELLKSSCALEMTQRKALVVKILTHTPNPIDLLRPGFFKLFTATEDREIQKEIMIKIVSGSFEKTILDFRPIITRDTLKRFKLTGDDWCEVYLASRRRQTLYSSH